MDDEQLRAGVDEIWPRYDVDNNGYLDKVEAKKFVIDMLESSGQTFDQGVYETMFKEVMDRGEGEAGDGRISKEEMVAFLRQLMGL
eukprot:CAMPEP_0115005526 /NCGR_PEP_ID=MMETSP0216-20121206/19927_1 /TAXON_ID=223996 /ORGANISM="Protocruzia adherens, Strain Boccale" /LENGTH=85 /DNA_ID=CAMNT_0002371875 /DNA_START=846 /DNA_END=1103 /DNA_ORIENTATION=-